MISLYRRLRQQLRLGSKAAANLHPAARVCRRTRLTSPCYVGEDVRLKDVQLGAYSYISPRSRLARCHIGAYVSIGPECLIGGLGRHPTGYFSTSPTTYSAKNSAVGKIGIGGNDIGFEETASIEIAEDVWIGARCVIIDGVRIGRGAIIGANTVVAKDVPPYAVFYGSPPKIHRYRFTPEIIAALETERWWEKPPAELDYRRLEAIVAWSRSAGAQPE